MAIFHLSFKTVRRSKAQNIIDRAALRSGENLYDGRLCQTFNHSKKCTVVKSEIFIPDGAPEWMKIRERVWNQLDGMERVWNGVPAREIQAALPSELTKEQNWVLAQDFAKHFTRQGMIADTSFHVSRNSNATLYILLSMREINLKSEEFLKTKQRSWNHRSVCQIARKVWQDLVNAHLAAHGHDIKIDHRSYAEQGIDLIPQGKVGVSLARRKREKSKGVPLTSSDRLDAHTAILKTNGDRIIESPRIALTLLSRQHKVFTDKDIAKLAKQQSVNPDHFSAVYQAIVQSPELILLETSTQDGNHYCYEEID